MSVLKKPRVILLFFAITSSLTFADQPAKSTNTSVDAMTARLPSLDEQVKADHKHVLHLQAKSRRDKDIIKLNCVNDRLVVLKPQLNLFDTIRHDLQSSLEGGVSDADARQGLFSNVVSAAEAVKKTRGEADACVGEPDLIKQDSSNRYTRPDILDDPSSPPGFGGGYGVEPPVYASPFN